MGHRIKLGVCASGDAPHRRTRARTKREVGMSSRASFSTVAAMRLLWVGSLSAVLVFVAADAMASEVDGRYTAGPSGVLYAFGACVAEPDERVQAGPPPSCVEVMFDEVANVEGRDTTGPAPQRGSGSGEIPPVGAPPQEFRFDLDEPMAQCRAGLDLARRVGRPDSSQRLVCPAS